MKKIFLFSCLFICHIASLSAQNLIFQDPSGRWKWSNTGTDAYFWGVNYSPSFAHGYRQVWRNGADHKLTIEMDAYHLSRMGINAFRIHVWDVEITDVEGNLLNNHHLNLLDYSIQKLQERGVHALLTPIAYWGNGYPEQNDPTLPGFSVKWSKRETYIEPAAIAAQENYLKQFLNHVNRYTGVRYKDDPKIIAIEINNEPGHSRAEETQQFVERAINAARSTGFTKPMMYNATHPIGFLENYIKAGADGLTFQWYPSGLVANRERPGTFLPHVDIYDMPFRNEPYFANRSRMVYEFDAADIGRSYLFPPMALSFKEAGMQWVTMFAYDPAPIAASNTEYQTHFLSLIYSPQKALGFKIAGELFRNPQFQRDRSNERTPFGMNDVNISYEKDLAELATDDLFFYTNTTATRPKNLSALQKIAGYGSSPVVTYNGRGAYFLDKIDANTWRLEVYPDAIWVRDPFSRATPRIENVVLQYNVQPMTVQLPGLGGNFHITGVNAGNNHSARAVNGEFNITPGAYILSTAPFTGDAQQIKIGYITANEFYAPPATNRNEYVLHTPQRMILERQPLDVDVEVVSPHQIKRLTLQFSGPGWGGGGARPVAIPMTRKDHFLFSATIPDTLVNAGMLNYVIRVEYLSGNELVYPGAVQGPPNTWDYFNPQSFSTRVLPARTAIELYSAENGDAPIVWSPGLQFRTIHSGITGETTAKLVQPPATGGFTQRREERAQAFFVLESFVKPQIEAISNYAGNFTNIVITAKAENAPVNVEVSLISKSGGIYTGRARLARNRDSQTISLSSLQPGRMMLLPRPFPGFQPFWYSNPKQQNFNLNDIERIQLAIPTQGNTEPYFEIKSIRIE